MNLGPYPFTLRQLQYAVAVAESLSFRKAAESCHVSQPSLSAQLATTTRAAVRPPVGIERCPQKFGKAEDGAPTPLNFG